ncbi:MULTISPECIES: hypothetical protein [Planomicrobium]|uniref:YtxH domain-containing protein n=1 Tax=Planomicrobium okeanokoites TaxID=244 RepID=A0ABV7KKI8_PLAOK|nr:MULTISPECIES: hypothetical protein [Planomicrobium]PKH11634.1 hypothetical protein CXF70_03440 [Planomicrobium sp. MB-3u-38]TAA68774.1 hypothetical protein D2910_10050 [Planomicrobium okeanokoites]
MAKGKGRGLLLAGLAVGAYTYFKNPENREKATLAFNNAKEKVNSYMESQNLDDNKKTAHDGSKPQEPRENKMVSEGAMTSVQYYNEEEQQKEGANEEKTKLSPNDTSKEKTEDTESASPEPKINTDNI